MPINVQHQPPAGMLSDAAFQAGKNQYRNQYEIRREQRAAEERQRQFQYAMQQQQLAASARGQQQSQQYGMNQLGAQAYLQNQQQQQQFSRQKEFLGLQQQGRMELGERRFEQEQISNEMLQVGGAFTQSQDVLNDAGRHNLNPEGQALVKKMDREMAAINTAHSTGNLNDAQHRSAMMQWQRNWTPTQWRQYVNQAPPPIDDFRSNSAYLGKGWYSIKGAKGAWGSPVRGPVQLDQQGAQQGAQQGPQEFAPGSPGHMRQNIFEYETQDGRKVPVQYDEKTGSYDILDIPEDPGIKLARETADLRKKRQEKISAAATAIHRSWETEVDTGKVDYNGLPIKERVVDVPREARSHAFSIMGRMPGAGDYYKMALIEAGRRYDLAHDSAPEEGQTGQPTPPTTAQPPMPRQPPSPQPPTPPELYGPQQFAPPPPAPFQPGYTGQASLEEVQDNPLGVLEQLATGEQGIRQAVQAARAISAKYAGPEDLQRRGTPEEKRAFASAIRTLNRRGRR